MSEPARPQPPELRQFMDEYLQSSARDQPADRQQLLAQFPEFARELRRFFESQPEPQGDRREESTLPPRGQDASHNPPSPQPACGTIEESQHAASGQQGRIFDDYELLEEVARGGMGVVYKARQIRLNRIVALKMILSGPLACQEDIQRFNSEAEAAANLDHPGIVPIYEIGEHDGQHFFTMGYVDGQSLAETIKDGPLPPEKAARITRKVAEAVAYAHSCGVIHRDLKPGNIMLDKKGVAKVTDFGLAKRLEGDRSLTRTGEMIGTPGYMPPEQASSQPESISEAADVYSLGAVLYALLTGRPPFQAATQMETVLQVLERDPASPRALNPQVPRDLETITLKCLEKDPSRRYRSAIELSLELLRFLNDQPIKARPISLISKGWRWSRRNPLTATFLSLALLLCLLLLLVSSIFVWTQAASRARAQFLANRNMILAESELAKRLQMQALLYAQNLRFAQREAQLGNTEEARELLESCEESQRSWEYDYLRGTVQLGLQRPGQATRNLARFAFQTVTFSEDGTMILGAGSDGVRLLRSSDGVSLLGPLGAPDSIARLTTDGQFLVSGGTDTDIRIWSVPTGRLVRSMTGSDSRVNAIYVSPDDRLVLCGHAQGELRLWNMSDGQLVYSVPNMEPLGFERQKGRVIAAQKRTEGKRELVFLDTRRGRVEQRLPGLAGDLVATHPDGKLLVAKGASPSTLILWSLSEGKPIFEIGAKGVRCATFSPDGKRIATGGEDHSIRILDVSSGIEVFRHDDHSAPVSSIRFSPDGKGLLSSDREGHTILRVTGRVPREPGQSK